MNEDNESLPSIKRVYGKGKEHFIKAVAQHQRYFGIFKTLLHKQSLFEISL